MKITFYVSTRYVGSTVEETFDDEKDLNVIWDNLTDEEKSDIFKDWLFDNIDSGYYRRKCNKA